MMKKFVVWWVFIGCMMYFNDVGCINNLCIMCFVEVLLFYVEVCLEINDESGVMKDINWICVCVGLLEKNLSGKDVIMIEFQKQKLLEFVGENICWDDMVCWYGNDFVKLKVIMYECKIDF